jgi:hypothetical protein
MNTTGNRQFSVAHIIFGGLFWATKYLWTTKNNLIFGGLASLVTETSWATENNLIFGGFPHWATRNRKFFLLPHLASPLTSMPHSVTFAATAFHPPKPPPSAACHHRPCLVGATTSAYHCCRLPPTQAAAFGHPPPPSPPIAACCAHRRRPCSPCPVLDWPRRHWSSPDGAPSAPASSNSRRRQPPPSSLPRHRHSHLALTAAVHPHQSQSAGAPGHPPRAAASMCPALWPLPPVHGILYRLPTTKMEQG